MKTLKMITVLFVFLILPLSILFSQSVPIANVNEIAIGIVERLDKVVLLTDSQKVELLVHAKVYAAKTRITRAMVNSHSVVWQRKLDVQEYKLALNSILTDEQKDLLVKQLYERREAVVKRFSSTKN